MSIFLKIALISLILSIVLKRIIIAIRNSATIIEQLTDDYGIEYYIFAILWLLSALSTVVCGILSIIFWK